MMNESDTFLSIIIDVDPKAWEHRDKSRSEKQICLNDFIKSLVLFCNAFCMMQRRNRLLVLGNHPDGVRQIYPKEDCNIVNSNDLIPTSHDLPGQLSAGIIAAASYIEKVDGEFLSMSTGKLIPKSSLANVLSTVLCGE